MKDKLIKVSGEVSAVLSKVRGSINTMLQGSPVMAAKLTSCVTEPFKAAFDAAGDLKASVSASASVEARVSASTK